MAESGIEEVVCNEKNEIVLLVPKVKSHGPSKFPTSHFLVSLRCENKSLEKIIESMSGTDRSPL